MPPGWLLLVLDLENLSGGSIFFLNAFYLISTNRTFKTSVKDLMTVPSWEVITDYWKKEIMTEIHLVWKKDPRQLCGVILDPVQFIPCCMKRFLMRQDRGGTPLAPGNYSIELKVGCDAGRHNWYKWNSGNSKRTESFFLQGCQGSTFFLKI